MSNRKHFSRGKNIITTENGIESAGEEKEMKNVEQNENSSVEIIDERLKRLCKKEIDGRERVKLREEKGLEGGKTKAPWKGKSTNILKRKNNG